MNIECMICHAEMEIIEDYTTLVKVHPCGCANDNAALTARLAQAEHLIREMQVTNEMACGEGYGAWSLNGKLDRQIDDFLKGE